MTRISLIGSALVLGVLVSCGGGGGGSNQNTQPATANTLTYVDPTSGTFQLKKNTTLSTNTHLVLDLVGPASPTGTGVTVTMTVDASRASWGLVTASDATSYAANGTVFNLGTTPQILKAKVSGGTLVATVAEKGLSTAKALNGPLLRVALDLKSGITPGAITLTADAAKCQVLNGDGTLAPLALTPGTLSAQ